MSSLSSYWSRAPEIFSISPMSEQAPVNSAGCNDCNNHLCLFDSAQGCRAAAPPLINRMVDRESCTTKLRPSLISGPVFGYLAPLPQTTMNLVSTCVDVITLLGRPRHTALSSTSSVDGTTGSGHLRALLSQFSTVIMDTSFAWLDRSSTQTSC